MKEFNAEQVQVETASALESVLKAGEVHCFGVYVGLDVHKNDCSGGSSTGARGACSGAENLGGTGISIRLGI